MTPISRQRNRQAIGQFSGIAGHAIICPAKPYFSGAGNA